MRVPDRSVIITNKIVYRFAILVVSLQHFLRCPIAFTLGGCSFCPNLGKIIPLQLLTFCLHFRSCLILNLFKSYLYTIINQNIVNQI